MHATRRIGRRSATLIAMALVLVGALTNMSAAEAATDTTAPTVMIYTPYDGLTVDRLNFVPANFACSDEAEGSGIASCVGTLASGATILNDEPLDTSSTGTKSLTVTATDNAGNVTTRTSYYNVVGIDPPAYWPFDGFYRPVDPQPVVNVTKAGSVIPVKFSLGGDRGMDILAEGSPKSVSVSCVTGLENDLVEVTGTPGNSVLTYDAGSDQYHYNWQTSKAWKNTCRTFVLELVDGSVHRASFRFF